MKFILTGLLFLVVAAGYCQTGTVVINDQAGATQLIEQHVLFNKEHGELPGYRIQVMATSSLVTAKEAKAGFLKQYDDYRATIVFEAPNYKLRIGNYTNRFDANRDLQLLLEAYPNALIVKDLISITE
ncbi:MAG TPA: SPOR domain-containing protein [Chitinophagales bacterium]|nr:SPOR domain-containing protein [Chitinophagales bacterium]